MLTTYKGREVLTNAKDLAEGLISKSFTATQIQS